MSRPGAPAPGSRFAGRGERIIESEQWNERQVVAAVLGGDRDAFRVLVDAEAASVVRACYRVLGDLHAAEDAAQEGFVSAYRMLATWRGDGPFGAWLTRIAVRIALREAGRRRPVAWLEPDRRDPASRGAADRVVAAASVAASERMDPANVSLREERSTSVRAAVAALDEPYREVVALRFFAELSLAEIATETGRPLGTVKTHLHRGLARLRASLAEVRS